jgi:hypothetical protein
MRTLISSASKMPVVRSTSLSPKRVFRVGTRALGNSLIFGKEDVVVVVSDGVGDGDADES